MIPAAGIQTDRFEIVVRAAAEPDGVSRKSPRRQTRKHPLSDWGTPAHSITSSARARIDGGTVRPSALAVLRLTTSSNRVGCWTGRSAGFSPLRIFPE